MGVLGGFDVLVDVLHHQELELLHRLADARLVGHGCHGVGRNQPQALDLARLDGREDVGLRQAARRGEEVRIYAPEIGDFLAILVLLQRPVAGQSRAGRPLAGAHGVALAGDRQAGAARSADIAGDQVDGC